jgi:hypothetical protein
MMMVAYQAEEKRAVLNPEADLDRGTTYKAVVRRGTRDLAGNRLESRKKSFFTTEGDPEPGLEEVASGLASPVHLLG